MARWGLRPCWRGQNAGAPFTTTVARAPLGLGVKFRH